ncbi:unnamed protein product [Chilo suppressalis]|uniref:Uncharacterized protein n=1 Tax=Chilo suppressalis TaxID=168631 RepID=A0ABN8BAM3_CHISP|nr:unnamed protein product [Chilo suppressalis]
MHFEGKLTVKIDLQGPVLFPNDSPPPPRPPLIVTSRPLTESISRSELNNSLAQSSQLSNVVRPYLARIKDYRPYNYAVATTAPFVADYLKPESRYDYALSNVVRPYLARIKDYRPYNYAVATTAPFVADYLKPESRYDYEDGVCRSLDGDVWTVVYDEIKLPVFCIEENRWALDRTQLPPIYKALSNHAKQEVIDVRRQNLKNQQNYEAVASKLLKDWRFVDDTGVGDGLSNVQTVPVEEPYHHRHNTNYKDDPSNDDYDQNKNYAFSYTVKDQKTGDDFSHSQHSSGSATNGEYRVRLPDGRMQIVSYTADENGYQADVRYDDEDKTAANSIDNNFNSYNGDRNHNNGNSNNDHDYIEIKNRYNDFNDKNDYQQKTYKADVEEYKPPANKDYYNQYTDLSKEYYNDDLSTEYESKSYDYAPHKSKFASFVDNKNVDPNKFVSNNNVAFGSTVTPSYEQLKDLLVTKKAYNTVQPYLSNIPVEINVPSTTPNYDFTTERVVLIGGKKPSLYTSVSSSLAPIINAGYVTATPSPVTYNNYVVSSTPRNYLVSTIDRLRNQVDLSGSKPVLSNSYIDRINKYLRFN